MRGATATAQAMPSFPTIFQSTHPMRGATENHLRCAMAGTISIHAPHAGCDTNRHSVGLGNNRFQSTHPMRGATPKRHGSTGRTDISIHAPHAGCDGKRAAKSTPAEQFQSTHPMRGATGRGLVLHLRFQHFNPRTPCGVRPTQMVLILY